MKIFRVFFKASALYSMWKAGVEEHLKELAKTDPMLSPFYDGLKNLLSEFHK